MELYSARHPGMKVWTLQKVEQGDIVVSVHKRFPNIVRKAKASDVAISGIVDIVENRWKAELYNDLLVQDVFNIYRKQNETT